VCVGVYLNGRQFQHGTHFEYLARLRVNQSHLAGAPASRGIGTVEKFYNLRLQDGTYRLFCALFVRVVRDATREMYTITKVIPPTQQTVVMYVDSIIRQVHLAPIIKLPEDDEVKEDEVDWDGDTCVGIPMWEVR
jgi:hypothetical protein